MRTLAALLTLALCLAGCSSRERLNPFDPANPRTGGRPVDFRALADDGFVSLQWRPETGSGLNGVQVFRRAVGEVDYTAISSVVSAGSGVFVDLNVSNGTTYDYRLYYVFPNGLGDAPAEDRATPGSIRPWVGEFSGGSVTRLTADGHYASARSGGFTSPDAVATDPNTGIVWVSDPFGGKVQVYDPARGTFVNITGLQEPGELALDFTDQTGWVSDPGNDEVRHYSRVGTSATPSSIPLLDEPLGIAFEQSNRILWVCERSGSRVRTFLSNGVPQWQVPIPQPSRVAVDSLTHEGWVTSFTNGKLYRISPSGAVLDSVTNLAGPIGVAVDPRRGRIWVCDAYSDRLLAFHRDASPDFVVTGLSEVREVDVDRRTGDGWATVPGGNFVVRVNALGHIVAEAGDLNQPSGISIDPGR